MSCWFRTGRQTAGPPRTGGNPRSFVVVHRLSLTVVLLFVTLTVIIGIAWLVIHPHAPTFRVSSLSLSNFTLSDSQLSCKYDITLAIKNPNKKTHVSIDHIEVCVVYDVVQLAKYDVQDSILLKKMRENNLNVSLDSELKKVSDDLGEDRRKGFVKLNVEISARVGYRDGSWPTKTELLEFNCYDLDVQLYSDKNTGKLRGTGKDCRVSSR